MTFLPALLTNVIHHQDARAINDVINQKIVSTTITSPPYFDMKDYGSENQIGYGQSYSEYLKDLKKVFLAIYNITKDNGTLWIIIDSFKKDGRVIPLPFDLERELTSIGWMLQDIIIWKKDRTVPWSSKGRTQRKFEYILFFSKTNNYNYYAKRVTTIDTDQLKNGGLHTLKDTALQESPLTEYGNSLSLHKDLGETNLLGIFAHFRQPLLKE